MRRLRLHWLGFAPEQVAHVVSGAWAVARLELRIDARGIQACPIAAFDLRCPCLECVTRERAPGLLSEMVGGPARITIDEREKLSDRLKTHMVTDESRLTPINLFHWERLAPEQVGAIAAYLFRIAIVREVHITRAGVSIKWAVAVDEHERVDVAKLEEELAALADADPLICPCGCGVPLILAPCVRDRGEPDVLMREVNLYRQGEKIQALREIRQRTRCSLEEARDRLNPYAKTIRP